MNMSQGVPSLMRGGAFACLLAAVIASPLPAHAAPAPECVLVPEQQPPAGMRWFLRTDRVKQRKCWYMGPINKNQAAVSQPGQPAPQLQQLPPPPTRAITPPPAPPRSVALPSTQPPPSPLKPVVS